MTKLSERIKKYNDPFLECRVRRHRMFDVQDDGGMGRKWVSSRTVRRLCQQCERCGTMRYEAWNAITGEILFAYYRYPNDYKISTNGELLDRRKLRKEYLQRD